MGNHSALPRNSTIHPVFPHLIPYHQLTLHHLSPTNLINETNLDNQQNPIQANPCPYDITSTIDRDPYDPWPNGWGHSPTEINEDTFRLFFKNPDGIMSVSRKACPKLMNGLQDMAELGTGMILLNEINCDVKRSDIRDTYKAHLDKHWIHSRTEFTCSTVKPQNNYLPGGSLIPILGHWTG